MVNGIRSIFDKLLTNKKQLFLIDGLGALLTAFCLGAVLAQFESTFGIPKGILYGLATVASGLALYSLFCYVYVTDNWKPYLRGVAIANVLYCCITIALVSFHHLSLTVLGLGYFLIELLVLSCLILLEFSTLSDG